MADGLPATVLDAVIDTSHWNGEIDWPAVAASGIMLAFIKATEGGSFIDPRFRANAAQARAAGIMVVPYHFIDASDGVAQAKHFAAVAALAPGSAAMIDWETAAETERVVAFGDCVEEIIERAPVGYYGEAQLRAANPTMANWPLMLPEYPRGDTPGDYASLVTQPPRLPPGRNPARPYDFHQYTRAGSVPGIRGSVDRSVWVGTKDELVAWHKTGALPVTF